MNTVTTLTQALFLFSQKWQGLMMILADLLWQ
jgi:hypothetical protein